MNGSSRGGLRTRLRLHVPNTPTPTQHSRLDYRPSIPNHPLLLPLIPPWRPDSYPFVYVQIRLSGYS
eukprot:3205458-Pleurochrysis_carterae.AAC.1